MRILSEFNHHELSFFFDIKYIFIVLYFKVPNNSAHRNLEGLWLEGALGPELGELNHLKSL